MRAFKAQAVTAQTAATLRLPPLPKQLMAPTAVSLTRSFKAVATAAQPLKEILRLPELPKLVIASTAVSLTRSFKAVAVASSATRLLPNLHLMGSTAMVVLAAEPKTAMVNTSREEIILEG